MISVKNTKQPKLLLNYTNAWVQFLPSAGNPHTCQFRNGANQDLPTSWTDSILNRHRLRGEVLSDVTSGIPSEQQSYCFKENVAALAPDMIIPYRKHNKNWPHIFFFKVSQIQIEQK